jgi:hypothetical protein
MAKDRGERAMGTPNMIYNLSSVLFHALKGRASYDQYIEDAEQEDDHELADFFRRVRDEDSVRSDEARLLLAEQAPATERTEDDAASAAEGVVTAGASPRTGPFSVPSAETAGIPPRPESSAELPGTEPIAEGAPSGDVRRDASITRTPEEDLALPYEAPAPRMEPASASPEPGDVSTRRTEEALPPSRMLGVEEGALPRIEEAPPSRTEEAPIAEEVSSGIPSQAPPGEVTVPGPREIPHEDIGPPNPPPRETPSESPSRTEETSRAKEKRAELEESEEDNGLAYKAKDYLLGGGRESDYPPSENRKG